MSSGAFRVTTALPINRCAAIFKDSMRYNFFKEFLGQGADFMKPPGDDAFGDLDTDPPDFEVMAVLGGTKSDFRKSGITMYAWNRDDGTEIHVAVGRAFFSVGASARVKARKFVDSLASIDPSAHILEVE